MKDAPPEARPVSTLWVLGVFASLLILIGVGMFIAKPKEEALDPADFEAFVETGGAIRGGFETAEARRLPSGLLVMKFESKGDAAGPFESLTLVQYPRQSSASVLVDQFQKLSFDGGESGSGGRGRGRGGGRRGGGRGSSGGGPGGGGDGGDSGPKLQDAGFLDWQGYTANYARLRHTATSEAVPAGGTANGATEGAADGTAEFEGKEGASASSYDTVRVNLTTGSRCVIAYVRFDPGETGSKELAQELLADVRLR